MRRRRREDEEEEEECERVKEEMMEKARIPPVNLMEYQISPCLSLSPSLRDEDASPEKKTHTLLFSLSPNHYNRLKVFFFYPF